MTKHVVVEPVASKYVGLEVAAVVQPVVRQLLGANTKTDLLRSS
jgi:hypothetical protein